MIYLLSGENTYSSWHELLDIRQRELSKDPFLSIQIVEGDEATSANDILKHTEMPSLLSSKSLVIVKRFFQHKSKSIKDDVSKLLKPDIDLIFWEDKVPDKRTILFKTISKLGTYQDFKNLSSQKLINWIQDIFRKVQIDISEDLIEKIIFRTSTNQFIIENDCFKLINYLKSQNRNNVEFKDILSNIAKSREESIWDMIDGLATEKNKNSLMILEDIMKSKEEFPLIISLITRQLRILYLICSEGFGSPVTVLAKQINIHPFIVKKALTVARTLGKEKIIKAYEKLLNLDVKIKQGIIDPKLGLDLFVLSFR